MKKFFTENMWLSFVIIFVFSCTVLALAQTTPVKNKAVGKKAKPHIGVADTTGIKGTTGATGSTGVIDSSGLKGVPGHTGPNNYDDRTPPKSKTKYDLHTSNPSISPAY